MLQYIRTKAGIQDRQPQNQKTLDQNEIGGDFDFSVRSDSLRAWFFVA